MAILDRVAARISRDRAVEAINSTFAPQQTAVLGNSAGNGLNRVGGMLSLGVAATEEGPTTLINIGRPAAAIWQPGAVASVTGSISNPFASGSSGTSITQPISGGGLVAHDIAGNYHTGVLADEQGPQFLLANGTRNLTGNLQVDPGITIDGIDLSVHAADPNAHHAQVHALDGTDHTGTLSWTKVDKAGSSLAHLETRSHNDLQGITANQHHNQVHSITGTDHTLPGGTAKFALVGASAANTLGLLTPITSSIGPVEGILKSDAAGAIELVKLRTQTIDTNTGQSLTLQPTGDLSLHPGTNKATLASGKGIETVGFTSAWTGTGARLELNSGTSKGHLTVDNMWVRGTLNVYELLIQQIRATNGSVFVTAAAKIASATLNSGVSYKLVVDASTNDYCPFAVGDIIRAQRVNLQSAAQQAGGAKTIVWQSDLEVTAINVTNGTDTQRTFNANLIGATTAPAAGMEFVRLGNKTDVARQGAIYLTADDQEAPFIDVVNGVTSHAGWNTVGNVKLRLGKLTGITSIARRAVEQRPHQIVQRSLWHQPSDRQHRQRRH